ncbi:hypothetical protein BDW22DRAFT_1426685 [Trametopsis cervina]|nr:hypothetical protein BDW22DRAFT_1426685 [Trametopsis cervina]
MMPLHPPVRPATEVQRQVPAQYNRPRTHGPPSRSSSHPQPASQPRKAPQLYAQPQPGSGHGEVRKAERPWSPSASSSRIYANWNSQPPAASSSRQHATHQPPQRRSTLEVEPSNSSEARQMGFYKRKCKAVPMMLEADEGRMFALDVGGHNGVCVKEFLENPAARARLARGQDRMPIEDGHMQWRILWPGYYEEIYNLAVGPYPTYEAVVTAICRAITKFVEVEKEFRDERQPENLGWWKLGRGGITTDRIWVATVGENTRVKVWVSHLFADFPDDPSQLRT